MELDPFREGGFGGEGMDPPEQPIITLETIVMMEDAPAKTSIYVTQKLELRGNLAMGERFQVFLDFERDYIYVRGTSIR